jgi:hypothetical protein
MWQAKFKNPLFRGFQKQKSQRTFDSKKTHKGYDESQSHIFPANIERHS